MLIPFRYTLYQAAVSPGDVFVALTGVAADPQVGEGTVYIETVAVTPPVEELVIGGRKWYGILEDVTVHLEGVAARPRVGKGTVVAVIRDIAKLYPFPKRQVAPKSSKLPTGIKWGQVKVKLNGAPQAVPAVGTGTVKIVLRLDGPSVFPELSDEEIMAILEVAA